MSRIFTAAIAGLGQVGQGYDYENTDSSLILTHASAYTAHPGFQLIAGIDVGFDSRQTFASKFGINVFENINALRKDMSHVDIISIAVPTHLHFEVFKQALALEPLVILCEKPIAITLTEAHEMECMARNARCMIAVNYTRRFNPHLNSVKKMLNDGAIGRIYKGSGWYTKGIVHCGSHFVDLLIDFLGQPQDIRVLNKGRMWDGKDPEPDISLRFGDIVVYLLSGREECFSMGEIELFGTRGRFAFRDGEPMRLSIAYDDPVYSGYRCLGIPEEFGTKAELSMYFTVDNIYEHLTTGAPLLSDADTAIETMRVVESIMKKVEALYE